MEMLEVVERIRQSEATVQNLFGQEGRRVSELTTDPKLLAEAATLYMAAQKSRRAAFVFAEAMSTSDFPLLMADIIDRQMLGFYEETTPTWQAYARRGTVNDFKEAKRFAVDGAEGALDEIGQGQQYPEDQLTESEDRLHVAKFGRRLSLFWEAKINDDLDAFGRMPERLARAARRSESKFATELFVGEKGQHEELYKAEYSNVLTGNPALSIQSMQEALVQLSKQVDEDDEPINIDMVTLVVPPALRVVALNILNALSVDVNTNGGTEKQRLRVENWMKNEVQLQVEPYIPHIATKENGDTSWFLFASPSTGRPAIELAFLRGYETPDIFEKAPNARRVGGGGDVAESFEDDSLSWRVRHVLGGTRLTSTGGTKATIASDGGG